MSISQTLNMSYVSSQAGQSPFDLEKERQQTGHEQLSAKDCLIQEICGCSMRLFVEGGELRVELEFALLGAIGFGLGEGSEHQFEDGCWNAVGTSMLQPGEHSESS